MKSSYIVLFCAASTLALHGVANAQTNPAPAPAPAPATEGQETSRIDDIVVTAQRRSERLNDVGVSIAAVGGEELAARGINDASDLANVVPGFSATDSGQNVPVYSLRGIGFNESSLGANPAVAVYVDEVPLPYAGMTRGAAFDLARVEVLKGPQGTLYGANSTGGAINYIANRPTAEPALGGSVSYGRFNTFEGSGYLSGPLTDTLTGRLAINTIQAGDWQRSTTRDDTLGQQDRINARGLLAWTPTDTFRLTLNMNGWRDRSDMQAFQLQEVVLSAPANASRVSPGLLTATPAPADARAADWDANTDFSRNDYFYQAAVKADADLTDTITLTSITAYSKYVTRTYSDRDGTAFVNSGNLFDGDISSFYQEVRLASSNPDALSWIVGANYRKDDVKDNYGNIIPDSSSSFAAGIDFDRGNINASTEIEAIGVFANVDYKFNDVLSGTFGARYSRDDRTIETCVKDPGNGLLAQVFTNIANGLRAGRGLAPIAVIPAGNCVTLGPDLTPTLFTGNLTEDNVSWRGALNWRPIQGTLVYGSVSQGYKSGSFPTVSATATSQYRPVTQESVLAYELGVKSTVVPGELQVNASIFYYDYTDKQVKGRDRDPTFGLVQVLTNVPKSVVQGAEAEIAWSPLVGLNLALSATYIDAKVEEYVGFDLNATAIRDFKGERLPYTSEWSVNFSPSYDFPVSDTLEGFVAADVAYRSDSSSFFGNSAREAIPAYTTLDLRAGVKSADGRWTATVWGRNVTDEYYWTNTLRAIDTYSRVAALPRTYGVSLSLTY
ncbi:TonB-dependent receptor [soil metagenome]